MQKINLNLRFWIRLMIVLAFSGSLLPLVKAETSASDNQSEGPQLEAGEFVFPEYTDKGMNLVEVQAIRAAEADAAAHLNKLYWFTTGFSLPIIGPLLSQRNQRSIPGARLLGKSPEYVAFYTNAYRIKMKKLRFNWSLVGCLSSVTVGGLTIFFATR